MFLQWKLILQKTNLKYFTLILFVSFFVVGVLMFTNDSCSVDHLIISNFDIEENEKGLFEFCENVLEKIDSYNDQCESQIEILDCG